jgi:hypothetical protein
VERESGTKILREERKRKRVKEKVTVGEERDGVTERLS